MGARMRSSSPLTADAGGWPRGLYLIRRQRLFSSFGTHDALLSVGVLEPDVAEVVEHTFDAGLRRRGLAEALPESEWDVVASGLPGELPQAESRLRRLMDADECYDLLDYNCEHFATEVLLSTASSVQIDGLMEVLRRWPEYGILGALASALVGIAHRHRTFEISRRLPKERPVGRNFRELVDSAMAAYEKHMRDTRQRNSSGRRRGSSTGRTRRQRVARS